ncbi:MULTISPECIES: toxin-activating lysine-acyltransferase [Xanthomonas]|uniref:toxin-activating lysine-acyltransferase n=1 Tax=Xanthomonas TaxID=338 RepID=UPI000E5AC758|nr:MULTISPECIES: toxin-activating lysine-acyltransferase [Xanthomonas]CAD1790666.1 toxin-activating lysine-acyltransferase [Xanthomonas sp. CPBF 426]CAG2088495.1 toxin-activating lysine-acyltransferase [Xanthomonas euroxanthea]
MSLQSSPDYDAFSAKLGAVFDICSRVNVYCGMSLLNLRAWIIPAIELNQVVIFYDQTGIAVAYFSWAYLDRSESKLFVEDLGAPLTHHQRLEGDEFWITDLVATGNSFSTVKKFIKEEVGASVGVINYKNRKAHTVVRIRLKLLNGER